MSQIFSSQEFYVDTHNKILYSHCMSSCCHPTLIIQGDFYSFLNFIGQDQEYITCMFKDLKFEFLLIIRADGLTRYKSFPKRF